MARRSALLEAVAVAAGAAAAGGLALRPVGLAPLGALVGGANGALSGWRGIYDWRRPEGWVAAALDSTWGLVGITAGLAVHAASAASDGGYVADLSHRQGRHVYQRGWNPRRGFAFTAGNVITGAGDPTRARRRRLVERHEGLHVWQQRWFGPFFPVLYGGWMAGGALTGTIAAARGRGSWFDAVERHTYYYNPFERWAYAHDHNWPPGRLRRNLLRATEQPGGDGQHD